MLRLTIATKAYGKDVWSWRRGGGVKFWGATLLESDGGKKPVTGEKPSL